MSTVVRENPFITYLRKRERELRMEIAEVIRLQKEIEKLG